MKIKRGRTKVMQDRWGNVRVQEEIGDTVRVYSLEEWNKEVKRREKGGKPGKIEEEKKGPATGKTANPKEPKGRRGDGKEKKEEKISEPKSAGRGKRVTVAEDGEDDLEDDDDSDKGANSLIKEDNDEEESEGDEDEEA